MQHQDEVVLYDTLFRYICFHIFTLESQHYVLCFEKSLALFSGFSGADSTPRFVGGADATPAYGAGGATPAYGVGGATPAYGVGSATPAYSASETPKIGAAKNRWGVTPADAHQAVGATPGRQIRFHLCIDIFAPFTTHIRLVYSNTYTFNVGFILYLILIPPNGCPQTV